MGNLAQVADNELWARRIYQGKEETHILSTIGVSRGYGVGFRSGGGWAWLNRSCQWFCFFFLSGWFPKAKVGRLWRDINREVGDKGLLQASKQKKKQ